MNILEEFLGGVEWRCVVASIIFACFMCGLARRVPGARPRRK